MLYHTEIVPKYYNLLHFVVLRYLKIDTYIETFIVIKLFINKKFDRQVWFNFIL